MKKNLLTLISFVFLVGIVIFSVSFQPHEHIGGVSVEENRISSTCAENGSYDEVMYCTECGQELLRTTVMENKIPHSIIEIPAKAPTCTESGLTKGRKCEVCGKIVTRQLKLPPEHTYDNVLDLVCNKCGHIREKDELTAIKINGIWFIDNRRPAYR